MAKPSITLRSSTAPSPLTYAQLDQNFTNLQNATISLDAGTGGTTVTTDLNGKITLVAGSNVTLTGDNTAKTVTIASSAGGATNLDGLSDVILTGPINGQVLKYNGTVWINDTDANSGGSGTSTVYSSLALTSNQTIPSATDTIVQWAVNSDPYSWFTGSPNYRIIPTESGRYFISLQVFFEYLDNGDQVNCQIKLNNTTVSIALINLSGASANGHTLSAFATVSLNGSTDYISATVFNGDSTPRDIKGGSDKAWTKLEIFKI